MYSSLQNLHTIHNTHVLQHKSSQTPGGVSPSQLSPQPNTRPPELPKTPAELEAALASISASVTSPSPPTLPPTPQPYPPSTIINVQTQQPIPSGAQSNDVLPEKHCANIDQSTSDKGTQKGNGYLPNGGVDISKKSESFCAKVNFYFPLISIHFYCILLWFRRIKRVYAVKKIVKTSMTILK